MRRWASLGMTSRKAEMVAKGLEPSENMRWQVQSTKTLTPLSVYVETAPVPMCWVQHVQTSM